MKHKIALLLLLTALTLGAQETLTPLLLLEKLTETSQWSLGENRLKRELLDNERRGLAYKPYLVFSLDPAYSLTNSVSAGAGGNITTLSHRVGGSASAAWRLPSNGTLTLGLADSLTFLNTEGSLLVRQEPALSLSFSQPIFINGRFIEGRAYGAEKRRNLTLPALQAESTGTSEKNALISSTLGDYYDLLLLNEYYLLKTRENYLLNREMDQLSSLKDRGMYSGADYWNRQLGEEQADDALLEMRYNRDSQLENLAFFLGMDPDALVLPVLTFGEETIPLPEKEELKALLTDNGDLKKMKILYESDRLAREAGSSQKGSALTLGLSVSPRYAPAHTGSDTLPDSFTDLGAEGAWVQSTLSLGLSFSPTDLKSDRLSAERDRMTEEISRLNYENMKRDLEEQLNSLWNRDEMLRKKLDRLEESMAYQKLLLEKEEKLLALSSSTPLAVERARLNLMTREYDHKAALVEFSRNRLALLQLAGYDMTQLDYNNLPGGTE